MIKFRIFLFLVKVYIHEPSLMSESNERFGVHKEMTTSIDNISDNNFNQILLSNLCLEIRNNDNIIQNQFYHALLQIIFYICLKMYILISCNVYCFVEYLWSL